MKWYHSKMRILLSVACSIISINLLSTSCAVSQFGGGSWQVRPGGPIVLNGGIAHDFSHMDDWEWSLKDHRGKIHKLKVFGLREHMPDLVLYSPLLKKEGTVYELLIDGKPACDRICGSIAPGAINIGVLKFSPPAPIETTASGWGITKVDVSGDNVSIQLQSPGEDQSRKPYDLIILKDLTGSEVPLSLKWLEVGKITATGAGIDIHSSMCEPGFWLTHGHSYHLAVYEIYYGHTVKVAGWKFSVPEMPGFSEAQVKEINDYHAWIVVHRSMPTTPDLERQFKEMSDRHAALYNRYFDEMRKKFFEYKIDELNLVRLETKDIPELPF